MCCHALNPSLDMWCKQNPHHQAASTARNSRDTKVKMARAFYERGEWDKAVVAFEKALSIGCGRHADAMRDHAHVRFVLWDMSDGDATLLKVTTTVLSTHLQCNSE
jgi:hypothetical protein